MALKALSEDTEIEEWIWQAIETQNKKQAQLCRGLWFTDKTCPFSCHWSLLLYALLLYAPVYKQIFFSDK